ncbi:MAG: hypothetical protein UC708_04310 [Anaerovoracaceae bacterium]|nr:hypothetical protein [Bacillota bacterium]MEE0517086.1 hypothetical protein [Anaerovoracaceae bacterium]
MFHSPKFPKSRFTCDWLEIDGATGDGRATAAGSVLPNMIIKIRWRFEISIQTAIIWLQI